MDVVAPAGRPRPAKSPLNLTDPESVREVHDDYSDAGARILTTNTWDANRVKLTAHEWSDSLEKINREGVRIARESASGELAFIAGSVGPLGALVKPYGSPTRSVRAGSSRNRSGRSWRAAWTNLLPRRSEPSRRPRRRAARGSRGDPIVAGMTFLSDRRTAFGESAPHALDAGARGRRRRRD
jgi:hypothetical protein